MTPTAAVAGADVSHAVVGRCHLPGGRLAGLWLASWADVREKELLASVGASERTRSGSWPCGADKPSPPSATVVLFLRIVRSDGQPAESAGLLFAGAAGGQADSLAAAAPDAEAGTAPVRRQHRPGALQCGRYRSVLSDMRCAVSAPYLMRGVCRGECASNCLLATETTPWGAAVCDTAP
eukprot:SAG25_NODE_2191_length_1855_cov_1.302392_2_plen_180_part_00